MSQTSLRYRPVFIAGAYWRMDISWRTLPADDHAFIDEWTAPGYALPAQAATDYTYMMFRNISCKATEDGELIAIDNVEITLGQDATTEAFLAPTNDSAECRLWWSADNVTWWPVFWGLVDLESVNPETERHIGTTWIKRYTFTAYDCIRRLNAADFSHIGLIPDLTGYVRNVGTGGTHEVYLGNSSILTWDVAWLYPPTGVPVQSLYAQPYTDLVKYIYWLIAPAKVCFPEHLYQTPATAQYLFHSPSGTSTLCKLGAYEASSDPLGTPVEAEFTDWWIPYGSINQGEFANEWENLGEVVAELATGICCGVTTRHVLEAGGQWVRQLWYIPRNSVDTVTVQSSGILLRHDGPGVRFETSRVLVTTRTPEGATPVNDVKAGTGDREVKINTHLRTLEVREPGTSLQFWPDRSPNRIRNIIWQCLVIPSSTAGRMQIANYALVGVVQYPSVQGGVWTDRASNGYASALANWFNDNVYASRARLEEEYSRASASDGTTTTPAHWVPNLMMNDDEDIASDYRILEVDIDIENNRVKVIKEKI